MFAVAADERPAGYAGERGRVRLPAGGAIDDVEQRTMEFADIEKRALARDAD